MNGVETLYREFTTGLEMQPSPEDATFAEFWELYTEVTHLAGVKLLDRRMGANLESAEEVQLHMRRYARVARISVGMPLPVPKPAVRAMRAMGRLIEATPDIADVGAFLALSAPIANDLSEYASTRLGRLAMPVIEALTIVGRSGTLMTHVLQRAVPELIEEPLK